MPSFLKRVFINFVFSKLKSECGCQFTSKLEGMFKVCRGKSFLDQHNCSTFLDQHKLRLEILHCLCVSGYDFVQHGERGVQSAPEQHLHQLERGKEKSFLGEILRQLLLSQVDMSVRVLTTGFWPGQNAPPHINLPRIPAQVRSYPIFPEDLYCTALSHDLLLSRPSTCSRTSTLPNTAEEF